MRGARTRGTSSTPTEARYCCAKGTLIQIMLIYKLLLNIQVMLIDVSFVLAQTFKHYISYKLYNFFRTDWTRFSTARILNSKK